MKKFYAAFLGLILLSCVMSTPVLADSDKCLSTSAMGPSLTSEYSETEQLLKEKGYTYRGTYANGDVLMTWEGYGIRGIDSKQKFTLSSRSRVFVHSKILWHSCPPNSKEIDFHIYVKETGFFGSQVADLHQTWLGEETFELILEPGTYRLNFQTLSSYCTSDSADIEGKVVFYETVN